MTRSALANEALASPNIALDSSLPLEPPLLDPIRGLDPSLLHFPIRGGQNASDALSNLRPFPDLSFEEMARLMSSMQGEGGDLLSHLGASSFPGSFPMRSGAQDSIGALFSGLPTSPTNLSLPLTYFQNVFGDPSAALMPPERSILRTANWTAQVCMTLSAHCMDTSLHITVL